MSPESSLYEAVKLDEKAGKEQGSQPSELSVQKPELVQMKLLRPSIVRPMHFGLVRPNSLSI